MDRVRPGAWIASAVLALVVAAPLPASAAAKTTACSLITAKELRRAFDTSFTPEPGGRTACLRLSSETGPLAQVTVSIIDSLSAQQIAGGKRAERKQPGAVVLKSVGDLAVMRPEPKTDTSGNTTVGLLVFEGSTVGQVAVTIDGETPTTKQMRTLAKAMAKRLR